MNANDSNDPFPVVPSAPLKSEMLPTRQVDFANAHARSLPRKPGAALESAWNLLGCSNGCTVHCTDITDNVKEWFGMVHKLRKVLLCPWQSIACRQHSKAARFLQPAFLPTLPTHEMVRTCAMSPASKRKNSSRWESVPTSTTRDRSFCSKSNSFQWRITDNYSPSTSKYRVVLPWSEPHTRRCFEVCPIVHPVGAPKYALQGLHRCTVGILCEGSERWQRRVWIAHSGPILSNSRASDFLVTPNKRSNSETGLCSLYLRESLERVWQGQDPEYRWPCSKMKLSSFPLATMHPIHLYLIIFNYIYIYIGVSPSVGPGRPWSFVSSWFLMYLFVKGLKGRFATIWRTAHHVPAAVEPGMTRRVQGSLQHLDLDLPNAAQQLPEPLEFLELLAATD